MFSITNFSISKLNNAEYLGFLMNVSKVMREAGASTLGIDTAMQQQFSSLVKKITDQVYTANGSDFTAAMQAADDKRDKIYKRIRLRLQMVEYAEQNADLNACKDVVQKLLLAKYGAKVTSMPMHEETGVLEGFLMDIEQKLDMEAQEALGISADISALKGANEEFLAAYNSRNGERVAGDVGLTQKLRAEMNEIYQRICFVVQYLANDSSEANAEKSEACQSFIATLNVILADVKKRYNTRTGKGGVTEGEDEVGSEDEKPGDTPTGGENKPSGNDAPSGNDTPSGGNTSSGGNSSSGDSGFEEDEDGRVWM